MDLQYLQYTAIKDRVEQTPIIRKKMKENFETKRLATVKRTAELYSKALTEPAIRWLIFNEKKNGFSSCIRRIGRKILIDLDSFENWIDTQGQNAGDQ